MKQVTRVVLITSAFLAFSGASLAEPLGTVTCTGNTCTVKSPQTGFRTTCKFDNKGHATCTTEAVR